MRFFELIARLTSSSVPFHAVLQPQKFQRVNISSSSQLDLCETMEYLVHFKQHRLNKYFVYSTDCWNKNIVLEIKCCGETTNEKEN